MKMRRFYFAILFTYVLIVSLSACSPDGGLAAGADDTNIVTIEFYSWELSLAEQNKAVIAAFEEIYPHIRVNINYPAENNNVEYTEMMELLLLANVQVDVMIESSVARMQRMVRRGLFMPLDGFMEAEGIVFDEIYSVSSYVKGSHYGLPIDITPWFVMLNYDMLTAAGLPIPTLCWTWYDYREYARILTDSENGVFGSYFHTWNNYFLMSMYSVKLDNALFYNDGSLAFENPALRNWLQFRFEMENIDRTSVPLMDIRAVNMSYRSEFWDGRAAMLPTGTWMLAEIKDTENWPRDFMVAFAPLPTWPHGGVEGRTFSDTKMLSIPITARHPEEAYKFIRFYTTEGALIRAGGLVALNDSDIISNINRIIYSPYMYEIYHLESLYAVFSNPNLYFNAPVTIPIYDAEITAMFMEKSERFIVGGVSLDETIESMMRYGNEIIRRAQSH